MESLIKDTRFAVRMLIKKPGFTLLAVLSLALGIGLNSTIFSLVNAVLLRPLPVEAPDRLVRVYGATADGATSLRIPYPDYAHYRDNNEVFTGLAAVSLTPLIVSAGGQSSQVLAEVVSGNYFSTLRVPISEGRAFVGEVDWPGGNNVAVVSHKFWQEQFGGAADVVGKTVQLNGAGFTIVGVAGQRFTGTFAGAGIDVWVPAMQSGAWLGRDWITDRSKPAFHVMGRLRDGVTAEQAGAEMAVTASRLEQAYPQTNKGRGIAVGPADLIHGSRRNSISVFLAAVMVMVALVLMIACINVANLLLARAMERRREMAIRSALGASRARLMRQLFTESLLLSTLGGGAGLFAAVWATDLLKNFNPIPSVPLQFDLSLDSRVLGFTLAVSLVTGILLGLAPALRASKSDLAAALKNVAGQVAGDPRKSRLRSLLVVAQVALSLVLLISAALFIQSLRNAQSTDAGFKIGNGLAMDISLEPRGYTEAEGRRFYQVLIERIQAVSGVESACFADLAPLDIATATAGIQVTGREPPPGQQMIKVSLNHVSAGYFETLGIPLVAGRGFTGQDDEAALRVAIINETMARRLWPAEDPLGRQFRFGNEGSTVQIMGVARDVKYRTLGEDPTPHFYLPLLQNYRPSMTLLVRAAGDSKAMIGTIQQEVQAVDKDVQGFFARTLDEHVGFTLLPARLAATLLGGFGLLALALAVVGIYGVVAYSVSQRTRELGIRVALGARPHDIYRLIVGQGFTLTLAGVAAGLVAAYALTRFLSSLLFGVSATDLVTFGLVSLILAGVALAACAVPARRAARVDPMEALRHE